VSKSGAISFGLLSSEGRGMQRSGPSIGTLASALAKARVQLVNPEKSLVATIPGDKTKKEQTRRRFAFHGMTRDNPFLQGNWSGL
jgi:hypothetical protein